MLKQQQLQQQSITGSMPEHDSIQEINDRNESNSNVSQTQQANLAFNQSLKSSQSQAQP